MPFGNDLSVQVLHTFIWIYHKYFVFNGIVFKFQFHHFIVLVYKYSWYFYNELAFSQIADLT